MIALAIILEWKLGQTYFNAKCGTRQVNDTMVISEWDATSAGRTVPTPAEIATWEAEYIAAGSPDIAAVSETDALVRVLIKKGLVSRRELDDERESGRDD